MAFIFWLQTFKLKDYTKIYQSKGLEPKNKGHTNLYECCDLTKKVCLICVKYLYYNFFQMTKCTFNKYGPSGTVEITDGLCLLAINIITEKIYVFLWFWFMLLAGFTAVHLILRFVSIASPQFR